MPNICADPAIFTAAGNVLDITAVVPVTLAVDQPHTPVNNGAFTTERPLPGTVHHDTNVSWTNIFAAPVLAVPEVMCLGAFIIAPQPNTVLIRSRLTVAVGAAADTPEISGEFDSEFGGGFDLTDQNLENNPELGRLHRGTAAFVIREPPEVINPGQAINMKFRMASYTPQIWLANANGNSPGHEATVRNAYTRLWVSALGALT